MALSSGVQLTPKGERYAEERARAQRAILADEIERLLSLLDELDGDPDFEPSLGSPGLHLPTSQLHWADGDDLDREVEEGNDEPSVGYDDEGLAAEA